MIGNIKAKASSLKATVSEPRTYLKAILGGVAAGAGVLASGQSWWAGLAAAVGAFNLVYWPKNADRE